MPLPIRRQIVFFEYQLIFMTRVYILCMLIFSIFQTQEINSIHRQVPPSWPQVRSVLGDRTFFFIKKFGFLSIVFFPNKISLISNYPFGYMPTPKSINIKWFFLRDPYRMFFFFLINFDVYNKAKLGKRKKKE